MSVTEFDKIIDFNYTEKDENELRRLARKLARESRREAREEA